MFDAIALTGEPLIPQMAGLLGQSQHLPSKTLNEWWALTARRTGFQEKYLSYWNGTASSTRSGRPVDFVICPATPAASFKMGGGVYPGYTGVLSLLDNSVATVPAGKVRLSDKAVERSEFLGDFDKMIWSQCEFSSSHSLLSHSCLASVHYGVASTREELELVCNLGCVTANADV